MYTYVCVEIIFIQHVYKHRSTTVFSLFLDGSKAFVRLHQWVLFNKLLYKNVPLFIMKILMVWYCDQ